jgi:predicted nucleotidyltransferase
MYDKTSLRVLSQIYLNLGIHKRGLSKKLNVGMPSIDHAFKKINNLLKKQKSGNQIKYYIDYSKKAIAPALYAVEFDRIETLPVKVKIAIWDFLSELKIKPIIALIFGSYAKGDYSSDSDIDILLVFQKVENPKEIENTARKISAKTNTRLNAVYLDYISFKESFHDPTKEFFKNLKKDKILLIGIEWWRQLLYEEA